MRKISSQDFYKTLNQTEEGKRYLQLVNQAKASCRNWKKEFGFEIHHIQPRSLGGELKDRNNLVKFTYYEHCVAHALLAIAFPCVETLCAIKRMSHKQINRLSDLDKTSLEDIYGWSELILRARKEQGLRRKGTSRLYDPETHGYVFVRSLEEKEQKIKEGYLDVQKVGMCSDEYGSQILVFPWEVEKLQQEGWRVGGLKKGPASEIARYNLSLAHKGGKSHLGIPVSNTTRQKISETLKKKGCKPPGTKGRIRIVRDTEVKLIFPEDLDKYVERGYVKPVKKVYVKKGTHSATGKVWIHRGIDERRVPVESLQFWLNGGYKKGYSDLHKRKFSDAQKKKHLERVDSY